MTIKGFIFHHRFVLSFLPRTLVGGETVCSNCQNFHNCSVFKYSGVPYLSIVAFRHSIIPAFRVSVQANNHGITMYIFVHV